METLIIKNASVILPVGIAEDSCVHCSGGRIDWAGPSRDCRVSAADEVIDARGAYLAPGFVDLHIHGSGEYLVDDGLEALQGLSRLLPSYGVTCFLPAVLPRRPGEDAAFLASLAAAPEPGARVPGFLLEGPFLSITGALPQEALGGPDPERALALRAACRPRRAVFAISPEFPDITTLLALMTEGGETAFITHTQAGTVQTAAAIEAGARHATHFYDVFHSPPESDAGVRPAGAVEAILADPRVTVDFILDGEHVDPVVVKMALQCKGPNGVCLVTDANRGAGAAPGRYMFGEHEVEFSYPGAPARFTEAHPTHSGLLAGSGLTMERSVRNAVSMLGVSIEDAVRMASANPARVLGLQEIKGRIAEGCDADLVLMDGDLNVLRTWVGGRCCYDSYE